MSNNKKKITFSREVASWRRNQEIPSIANLTMLAAFGDLVITYNK